MNIKKPVVVHDTIEEETAWLNNSLVGQITEGVNYQSIQGSLVDEGVQFYGFRFMGATQVIIAFESYVSIMKSFESPLKTWDLFIDELRPWLDTDCLYDRFTWITLFGLPILGWNVTCIRKS
jgi:hypothetical protein